MNVKTLLTSVAATAAIVGTIGFAYAQTDTTNRNADGTVRSTTQPTSPTGTMGTTPGNSTGTTSPNSTTPNSTMPNSTMPNSTTTTPGASGNVNNSTGTLSNNSDNMTTERAARADRN